MSVAEDSPSADRRESLKESDSANQLRVLGSCPLSKYNNIADRLVDRFQFAVDGRRLDEAYVFGLRYANLCLSGLPQHPEWKHHNNSRVRKRLTSQVGDVLGMMDVIKQRMDAEELMKIKQIMMIKELEEAQKNEVEQLLKHKLDEERHREQRIRDTLEAERAQFLAEQRSQRQKEINQTLSIAKKKTKASREKDIEKSAMAKLQALQSRMSSKEEPTARGEEMSSSSQKNTKKSKSIKIKAKEAWKPKNIVQVIKKKSSLKSKDEQSTSSSPYPTQSSKTKDDTPALLSVSTEKEETKTKNITSPRIRERNSRDQSSERKALPEENSMKKSMLKRSVKNRGSTIGAKNMESTTNSVASAEHKKIKKDQPSGVISTKGPTESTKKYPDSTIVSSSKIKKKETKPLTETIPTRSVANSMKKSKASTSSVQSKNSRAKSYIMSKLETSKSTMSTMLIPSINTSVNNSSAGKTTQNHVISEHHATTTPIASQQTPRSQKEKAIIDRLQRTILAQEDRIGEIEEKQVPSLLDAAKTFLKENNKKEALKCLAHKKRLERQVDTAKAAVFNMETQRFMLESAIEDRYVKKALDEAATAIAGFQQNIGDPKAVVLDMTNTIGSLPELDVGDSTDEELMEELQEWLSPEEKRKAQEIRDSDDDETLLLSMPTFLPKVPATTSSVDRILNVVLSE